jgi:hypothetical protein
MNKGIEKAKLTVSIPIKNDSLFRRQAFFARLELSDLFIEYQKAYVEMLNCLKGKNSCYHCHAKIKKFDEIKAVLCVNCLETK